MKILIAPDKFKGSLSAKAVCEAIAKGLKTQDSSLEIVTKPMADGGDGSLAVLEHYFDLKTVSCVVNDPLMRLIRATYKMAGTTAYIEMAAASGLVLLKPEERNCLKTTTYGTGELIVNALKHGAKTIYLFIGGSATNDGGIGMAKALGYHFKDKEGNELKPIGENMNYIDYIDNQNIAYDLSQITVKVICDVNNPFYGKNGAAHTYAAQKGATPQDIEYLDQGLQHLAKQLKQQNFSDISCIAGAGAAGGLGGGAIAFLNATLVAGITTFIEITNLEADLQAADIIITGEGKLDQQTEQGKVISGVCQLAQKYQKPVIAVCGTADLPISPSLSIQQVYTVLERANSVQQAMKNAAIILEEIGANISLV